MTIGVYYEDRKMPCQLRQTPNGLAIDSRRDPMVVAFHAKHRNSPIGVDDPRNDSEPSTTIPDQASCLASAKRAAAPEYEDSFQHTGLAGTIRPDDRRSLGTSLQFGTCENSKIGDGK